MSDGSLLLLGLEGPELTPDEAAMFRTLQPAGYVLAARNIVSPEQTRKLTDELRSLHIDTPVLAISQEGGPVTPLGDIAPQCPAATALAGRADMGLIADAAAHTGDMLRLLGFNMNLAPLLDLGHFPGPAADPHGRVWSRDPQRVIDFAGHWNRWLRKRSVASCAKSFPAGGRIKGEPSQESATSDASIEDLLREDVIPYTALMPELDAILMSRASFPRIDADSPAFLSRRIIDRFLRGQLGFDKHLVLAGEPDGLDGGIAGKAIEAGNDLAIIRPGRQHVAKAVEALRETSRPLRDDAQERVDRFRRRKLHGPLIWREDAWQKTTHALATLAAGFGICPQSADLQHRAEER